MYEGSIRMTYLDRPHSYYKQERINYGLPPTDDKAWGPKTRPKGATTILGDTLEKKGLMTWPLGLALTELFGFYDFEPEPGNRKVGVWGKKKGTLLNVDGNLVPMKPDVLVPYVQSAAKAWARKQKTGADIGSLVHDAIEQYVLGTPFALTLDKYAEGQEFETPEIGAAWLETAPQELAMALMAFERFKIWWTETKPELINTEQIVYSKAMDVPGAYDALLKIDGRTVLVDWKTSNASVSAGAPQGVYYSYFIQSAIYAVALLEMGAVERIDDLMIVSARKDGNFNAIFASEVGLSMIEAMQWAKAVVFCYRMMDKTKYRLIKLGELN